MTVPSIVREQLRVRGAVQGVGFRPFVYRLATGLGLSGWVENTAEGVRIEVEGPAAFVESFGRRVTAEAPPNAAVQSVDVARVEVGGPAGFAIRSSDGGGTVSTVVLPDLAMCAACRKELEDPRDRRFRYPFINCTDCGPRYSIILGLPYDRDRTTMRRFTMCAACRSEYEDPGSRRFHAEPIACPGCGPRAALWDADGAVVAVEDAAVRRAAEALAAGQVVAVKGLGGFHLLVDARSRAAVGELRRRKRREAKPLAVMVGDGIEAARYAEVGVAERALLESAQAPIVLLTPRPSDLAPDVAPDCATVGLMMPYTPLHRLLLAECAFPVVATSGNAAEEPICIDECEAVRRLRGIADVFLVHDRPIARYVDDSVARVMGGMPTLLRRARGYAPLPLAAIDGKRTVLGVGAHVKSSVALSVGGAVVGSPHVGDLSTVAARDGFERTIATLSGLYARRPDTIACDEHPDYASTRWAEAQMTPCVHVQHHYAHVLAGMADNGLAPPVLGIAWDGSGYGTDRTLWGGEALQVGERGFKRVAWIRPFPLPGGERAIVEPRRSAVGVLWEMERRGLIVGDDPAQDLARAAELSAWRRMLALGINCPQTSSAGRLFDAVAALVGLRRTAQFEGQAAMALEAALHGDPGAGDERYAFWLDRTASGGLVLDWAPMILGVRRDVRRGEPVGRISTRVHNTLIEMMVAAAWRAEVPRVVLTGGCFQNRYLTERAIARLREEGFEPYWHHRIPPNDGGIAVGQVLAAVRDGGGA
jgi:hydrogenase maturation protein HypF